VRISSLFRRGRPVFSFEFFPPKTDKAAEDLLATVADLHEALAPDFVSVTYGAGGSTRARTLECVTRIQKDLNITAMAHLACMGHNEAELVELVSRLLSEGIENILALRGDPPKDVPLDGMNREFSHATDLIALLRRHSNVCIGAACYPETHPEAVSPEDDIKWAKRKVELGAEFLITQLFFDDADYFAFLDKARAAGIEVPIVPGIMPITNVAQIERFTKLCGARIPAPLKQRLDRHRDDPAAVMAIGIEHAISQCRDLLQGGAPGLHFYTLNKSHATRSILAAIRSVPVTK
jgi:methylenetetrahydrofolate reductase (NADPH)